MIEFGKTLKAAREAKGLTILQVAEITRVLPSLVEELEKEDFSHIVAPIYGRGFVKLYCEAVELEPKPMIDEFMDMYSGNREPAIRTRESIAISTPKTEVPPPPAQAADSCDLTKLRFSQGRIRMAVIIIAAAAMLTLVSCGIRAIYRATSGRSPQPDRTTMIDAADTTPSAHPRTPITIAPLYMD